jgi:CBS domain-containing protein
MTSKLVCVGPDESIEACMAIMTAKRIRHLPVIGKEQLVGLVSIGDLVKRITREQEFEIQYLTDYITGKYPG